MRCCCCSHTRDDELAHLATRLSIAAGWSRTPCLALVGDGYPTSEVARALGITITGRIPHDPKGAAILSGASRSRRGPARTPLGRAAAGIAELTAYHARGGLPASATPEPATSAPDASCVPAPTSDLPVGAVNGTRP